MRNFVVYFRVSTKKQGYSGLGLEAQEHAVKSYLASQPEYRVVETFTEIESGKGKRLHKRVKLQEAIQLCKQEKATLVIAVLDRLARNVHFVSGLMEARVDFVCCDMPSANKLTIHVLAAVAEEEGDKISERTKKALAAAKRRGVKLGAPEEKLILAQALGRQVIQREAQQVYSFIYRNICAMAASGMSQQAIADQLNQEGFQTRTGAMFRQTTIHRILKRGTVECV